ncbi:MAG: SHOCT domain-containing protein, partial [Desulfobacula sp.]|nr:SHOCT domain-containing protein [Desulfobacula sp.]
GLASFKIAAKETHPLRIDHHPLAHPDNPLLEDTIHRTERKILELTALFRKDLITQEEFEKAKRDIIQG